MVSTIHIRPFQAADLPIIIQLFKEAVVAINKRHYSPEQIGTWVDIDPTRWQTKLANHVSLVAEINSMIVGFADMTPDGYLDHLYIHKDYQARFVSLHLLKAMEKIARELGLGKITTNCSVTAKVPAERAGFKVMREQIVEKKSVQFITYHMEKLL